MDKCPRCGGKVVKSGFALRAGGEKQKYQCRDCGKITIGEKRNTA